MDVIVIGAGIVGLGSALELVRRGANVTVLERGRPGDGASGAAAGMLAPVAEARWGEPRLTELSLRALELWPRWARELEGATGMSLDFREHGSLIVATDRDDLEALEHIHRLHENLDLDAQLIDGDAARAIEPRLSPTIPGAVRCPGDHQVDPRRVVAALSAALQTLGGRLVTGKEVAELTVRDGRVVALGPDDLPQNPDATYVLAAGAWVRTIDGLGSDRPSIRPVRGQMIAVALGEPPLCTHVIRTPRAYMVPRSDGTLVIGSTMEEVGFDANLTAGGVLDLLTEAWETIPAIYDAALTGTWTGFRPMSLDGEPILKRSETIENLIYAAGHGRNGILHAPLAAQTVADLVLPNGAARMG